MNTKEKIIMESLQFFLIDGYENTSLRDVAEKVNIKKSSIYYHFKNKEDLFVNCINYFLDSITHHIKKSLKNIENPEKKLDALITSILEFNTNLAVRFDTKYSKPINHHQMLKYATKNFIFTREKIDKYYDFLKSEIIDIVDTGKRKNLIKNTIDTDILTFQILSTIEGYMSLSEIYSSITGTKIRKQLRKSLWKTISKPKTKNKSNSFSKTILGARW